MTGFGLYETLRLLIPGTIAIAVLSTVLRLATGEGELLGGGPFASVIAVLQGTTFLFASLVAGFILYLVDLPSRTRVSMEGDPEAGYQLPTSRLYEMVKGTQLEKKSFSLYFILSDGKLPVELHRRVYFFGGMFRIYFDLRVLALVGTALGGPFALAIQADSVSPLVDLPYLGMAALLVSLMILATLVGESKHAMDSMRKDARRRGLDHPSPTLRQDYLKRTGAAVGHMWLFLITILLLSATGSYLADLSGSALRIVGLGLVSAAIALWMMAELGPPTEKPSPIRGQVMRLLRLSPAARTQYTQLQRGLGDLALVVPPLIAAAVSAQNLGRPTVYVLLWGVLAIPAALVLAVRKHEQRLLAAYKDQVNWLEINEPNILALAKDGAKTEWF